MSRINYLNKAILLNIIVILSIILIPWLGQAYTSTTFISKDYTFSAQTIIHNLNHPWAAEWLEKNTNNHEETPSMLIISERNGALVLYQKNAKESYRLIKRIHIPTKIFQHGQGGLLDIKKHPEYQKNGWIYLTYSRHTAKGATTELARFKLVNLEMHHWQVLFTTNAWSSKAIHFGSRIAFDDKNNVYFTVGDRGNRDLSQNIKQDHGSIIRLHSNGEIPKNNPFPQNSAVYSYGHRNAQGLWFDKKN